MNGSLSLTFGLVFLIPQLFYEKSIGLEVNFNKAFFIILFYVVTFPAIAAYYCWQKGVEIIGPNRASMFIQLMPLFSAVMAIVIAICTYVPKTEVRPFGLFSIKLMYLGIGIFLLDYLFLMKENTGGHIAHLGGAGTGYFFATAQKKGKDITKGINYIISSIVNLFKVKSKMKVVYSQDNVQKMSDDEYNKNKSYSQKEIDRILDKISASGYDSLSKKEKKDLYNFSNKK